MRNVDEHGSFLHTENAVYDTQSISDPPRARCSDQRSREANSDSRSEQRFRVAISDLAHPATTLATEPRRSHRKRDRNHRNSGALCPRQLPTASDNLRPYFRPFLLVSADNFHAFAPCRRTTYSASLHIALSILFICFDLCSFATIIFLVI